MANQTSIAELIIRLRDEVSQNAAAMTGSLGKLESGLGSIQTIAAGLGVGISVGAFTSIIRGAIDAGHELTILNEKTGFSVETLSALKPVLEAGGSSLDSFSTAVIRAFRNIASGDEKSSKATEALAKLGFTAEQISQGLQNPTQLLQTFLERLGSIENPAIRAQIAMDVMGRSAGNLIPTMLKLADIGFDNVVNSATKMSTETAAALDQLHAKSIYFWNRMEIAAADFAAYFAKAFHVIPLSVKELEQQLAALKFEPGSFGIVKALQNELDEAKFQAARAAGMARAKTTPTTTDQTFEPQKVKDAVFQLSESLVKQASALQAQTVGLNSGALASKEFAIQQEVAALKAKLLHEHLPIPADINERFANLTQEILKQARAFEQAQFGASEFQKNLRVISEAGGPVGSKFAPGFAKIGADVNEVAKYGAQFGFISDPSKLQQAKDLLLGMGQLLEKEYGTEIPPILQQMQSKLQGIVDTLAKKYNIDLYTLDAQNAMNLVEGQLKNFGDQAGTPIELKMDASGVFRIFDEAAIAYNSLKAKLSEPIIIRTKIEAEGSPSLPFSEYLGPGGYAEGVIQSLADKMKSTDFTIDSGFSQAMFGALDAASNARIRLASLATTYRSNIDPSFFDEAAAVENVKLSESEKTLRFLMQYGIHPAATPSGGGGGGGGIVFNAPLIDMSNSTITSEAIDKTQRELIPKLQSMILATAGKVLNIRTLN